MAAAIGFAPANHSLHRPQAPRKAASVSVASVHLSALESQLLSQINLTRGRHGLRALRLSAPLTAAADQHSQSMAQKGYFSHDSANGGSFFKRIATSYTYPGYSNLSAPANLPYSMPS